MFDVVMPNNNEEKFIDIALALNYKEIVFLVDNPKYDYTSERIKIKKAYLLKSISDLHKVKNFDYIFANAERKYFESKVDYIINADYSESKDSFHFKRTSLNQVHAKLAKENNIDIVFDFPKLIKSKKSLGRMMQNMTLCRKYKLETSSFTIANDPENMRSRIILDAFSKILI